MSYKVLIPEDITDAGKKYLKEKGYEIVIGSGNTEKAITKDVIDCDAVLARTAPYTRKVLEAGKKLKVISRHGAGTDNIDLKAATELGIQVTNAPTANSNAVSEHTMALVLACAINLVYMDKMARTGKWNVRNQIKCTELSGRKLGIIGLGKIGRKVAEKAINGFNMQVIGYDAYVRQDDLQAGIKLLNNIQDVFREADFITIHIPATPETKESINKSLFKLMKKDAYVVNCSRGEVVNENDLFTALSEHWIRGAALDVLQKEPPEKSNRLLDLDNLIISPHNAALTATTMDRMGLDAAKGIDEVLSGRKPTWPVNHLS